jgi:hypothetical protein
LFYKLLKDSIKYDLYKDEQEIFSSTTIKDFSLLYHIPTSQEHIDTISYINYKRLAPPPSLPSENDDITVL